MGLSRSENMARIRAGDTSPEKLLRRALWARGLRYRVRYRIKSITTDLSFPGRKIAVFVDGCFWHGCPEHYVRPRTRSDFWSSKLRENVDRDRRQTLALECEGWQVCRFWEHEAHENLPSVIGKLHTALANGNTKRTVQWRVVRVVPNDSSADKERRSLEALRDPSRTRTIEQRRHTRKWKASRDA